MRELGFSSITRNFPSVLIHREFLERQVVRCVIMLIRIKP